MLDSFGFLLNLYDDCKISTHIDIIGYNYYNYCINILYIDMDNYLFHRKGLRTYL